MSRTIARLGLFVVPALFMGLCLVALSIRAMAQEESKEKATKGSVSVTGCLQKGVEEGGYYIASDDKMWELSSQTVKLDKHVGHTVTVTGQAAKKSKAAEAKTEPNEKSEASGKTYGDLTVRNLKMVSESCSGY
jgi:hypothetical protein